MMNHNNLETVNTATINNDSNIFGGFTMNNTFDTMDAFATVVKNAISSTLGEEYEVDSREVLKNNGIKLLGITIKHMDESIVPTIYLESFYAKYKEGTMSLKSVVSTIISLYKDNRKDKVPFSVSNITNFDSIRDIICYKLINRDRNEELLQDAPYRTICGDLAVIYFIFVNRDDDGTSTITIRNDMLNLWNISEEDLYDLAVNNTQQLFRGSVSSIESVLADYLSLKMDENDSAEYFDLCFPEVGSGIPMYICSNTDKINGAGAVLYKDLLKEFAQRVDSDLYVLPSSIHEVILVPTSENMDIDYLKNMVAEINTAEVSDEEQLSDNVFIYNRAEDKLVVA